MANQGDLPRALRFAVSQIQPGSGPTAPMNEQDRAWLNEVLGEMVHLQEHQRSEAANRFHSETQKPPLSGISGVLCTLVDLIRDGKKSHIIDAVKNELQHIAEDGELLDRADDCDRRNAVAPISVLLAISCPADGNGFSSEPALHDMVAPLCSILAELAQNSPQCQEEALQLIPRLINVINSEGNSTTKTKAVYALSGILRGNQSSKAAAYLLSTFDHHEHKEGIVDDGAVDVLVKLVLNPNETTPARIKAAFLLTCLAEQRHDVRQVLSRKYERDLHELQHLDTNLKELVDGILKRIRTERSDGGKTPLALAM